MYLIINLGLKSIRGIVFSESGKQLYACSKAVYSTLIDNRVEQDVVEWKNKLQGILEEIFAIDSLRQSIEFITATTSSSCIFGMDAKGIPRTKVLMVSDKRAADEAEFIEAQLSRSEQFAHLKCPASSILPKAVWFKKNRPEVFEEISYWMGAGEFLSHYFTGEIFTDPLNASKGLYTGDSYPEEVCRNAGIDSDTLPPVQEIGCELPVDNRVIRQFGMRGDTKFVLTTYDAICAVIGSYDGEANTACDVSGTVTSVRVFSDKGLENGNGAILSQKLCNFQKHLIGASNNLGGGIIEWFKQSFFDENNKNVYYIMENYAHQTPIGAHGIVFLPYLLGERSPFKSPNARGLFFGIDRRSTLKDFSRAVFESTAYVTNDLLRLITDNGINVEALSVSGGLARFDLINQIKADVTNMRVKVIENFESTSVGALILLLRSLNKVNSFEEASEHIVKVRKVINPSEENHRIYAQFFDFFKDLNNRLEPLYDRHLELRNQVRSYSSEKLRNL